MAHVHLMPPAKRKLQEELHEQVCTELANVFSDAESVSVYDVLRGFNENQRQKLILAVETVGAAVARTRPVYETFVVKLGDHAEVAADVGGWERCILGRQVRQRMFVRVRLHENIGEEGRAAAVYEDAGQWYDLLSPDKEVRTLGWAVEQAVFDRDVDVSSIKRVIRQIFRELGRCLYHEAEASADAARAFYRSKLKLDVDGSVVDRWRHGELWSLSRDVDWLLCGPLSPASQVIPKYIDPCDFVLWALENGEIPQTLAGSSHGDLHAENVIVGVDGTEIEYPLLIDYGDMAPGNVVAWDFVKLECELKVRLLAKLFDSRRTRESVFHQVHGDHFAKLVNRWSRIDATDDDSMIDRTQRIVFAFEFERLLRKRVAFVNNRGSDRDLAGETPLGRALDIVQTIRSLAAEELARGGERAGLSGDELNFALAVYGLNTIKFSNVAYPAPLRLFSLVSAGVAAAHLNSIHEQLQSPITISTPPGNRWATYHVPLRHAYHRWQSNRQLDEAKSLLDSVSGQFDYSVTFRREHALLQSKTGGLAAAETNILSIGFPADSDAPRVHTIPELAGLCSYFLEIELLSRLGRINKDKADSYWEELDIEFEMLTNHTPSQFYGKAYLAYRKAFELSKDYYPGGNAAITGLLAGTQDALEIARAVARECHMMNLGAIPVTDQYWVLATEGDMSLLLGEHDKAAGFFHTAIEELPPGNDGFVQTSYNQLCRLYRVLGPERLRPVLDVFGETTKFALEPGPLGDCGGLFATV